MHRTRRSEGRVKDRFCPRQAIYYEGAESVRGEVLEPGLALRCNAEAAGQNGQRVRVLICSQVDSSLRNMAEALREAGFDVVTCPGFSELMDMAEDIHPRLIIIEEENWPWGRGVDLLTLRKISRAAVIAVGNSGEMETMARALNAGADYYLVKPFGRAELLARIGALLRR